MGTTFQDEATPTCAPFWPSPSPARSSRRSRNKFLPRPLRDAAGARLAALVAGGEAPSPAASSCRAGAATSRTCCEPRSNDQKSNGADVFLRTTIQRECSLRADAQGLHGSARQAFRADCKLGLSGNIVGTPSSPPQQTAKVQPEEPDPTRTRDKRPQDAGACKDDMSNCGGNSVMPPNTRPQIPWALQKSKATPKFERSKSKSPSQRAMASL
jgi:hypothetical protein